LHEFEKLLKIRGANGVLIQESLKGKEIFFGIKKNPEFGYVILFGTGGTNVENSKDVAFRVLPLNKDEIRTMVKETAVGKKLSKSELFNVEENLLKLCGLIEKFPNIYELDINPIFIKNKKSYIADARIVFV
jgi:acetyltransferase